MAEAASKLRKVAVPPSKPESSNASKRCRPYTQSEWNRVRPIIKNLYLDLDLKLREIIQRLEDEHGFYATWVVSPSAHFI